MVYEELWEHNKNLISHKSFSFLIVHYTSTYYNYMKNWSLFSASY